MHISISHGHRQWAGECWDGWELGGNEKDGGDICDNLNNKDKF